MKKFQVQIDLGESVFTYLVSAESKEAAENVAREDLKTRIRSESRALGAPLLACAELGASEEGPKFHTLTVALL